MSVTTFHSLDAIKPKQWDLIKPDVSPFLHYNFLQALEHSQVVGASSGWQPLYFSLGGKSPEALLYTFEKHHSYGEYIFDWAWAEAYQRHGLAYYPKLTSMIPMTPVLVPHFVMSPFDTSRAHQLLAAYEARYQEKSYSSSHFLFLNEAEREVFTERDYLMRQSVQYHFNNEAYEDFDDFLCRLKRKKSAQIRRERKFPESIEIQRLTGDQLNREHACQMYQFYVQTIMKKGSMAYWNQALFEQLFAAMPQNILYVQATDEGQPVAGAWFFYDKYRLYGRYWGCAVEYPNLHFELCYYQGIEFCIERQLKVFEAGAQGEHKVTRGFRPVTIYSAHQLKNQSFHGAVEDYIVQEQAQVRRTMALLAERLPFK